MSRFKTADFINSDANLSLALSRHQGVVVQNWLYDPYSQNKPVVGDDSLAAYARWWMHDSQRHRDEVARKLRDIRAKARSHGIKTTEPFVVALLRETRQQFYLSDSVDRARMERRARALEEWVAFNLSQPKHHLPCGLQDADWQRSYETQVHVRVMRAAIKVLSQAGL